MAAKAYEVNFDGIVGPTHNYAGLSRGNLASQRSKHAVSNPKAAALEGLAKMKVLADLGVKQAVLPPHERPDVGALRRLGFSGGDADVLWKANRADPVLLATCCSASAMWAANAATVSPSADTADGRVHFTPANLVSQPHRSLEAATTARVLRALFSDPDFFVHHAPLQAATAFGDEGAANHLRLATSHAHPGVEVFVYGRRALDSTAPAPLKVPARQTLEASQAVARLHSLRPDATLFVQQNPAAVDGGAFHNDVVSVANENVLLYHEEAFLDAGPLLRALPELVPLKVSSSELSADDAVTTYLFNSQLASLPGGGMALVAPSECADHEGVCRVTRRLLAAGTPLKSVHYVDVRQSMSNGGGPACLRLRVVLTDRELAAVPGGVFLDERLFAELIAWVNKHYRDRVGPEDLADPALLEESRRALDALCTLLGLPSVYTFQISAPRPGVGAV